MTYITNAINTFTQHSQEQETEQEKSKSHQVCNYQDNYYGDQVCMCEDEVTE